MHPIKYEILTALITLETALNIRHKCLYLTKNNKKNSIKVREDQHLYRDTKNETVLFAPVLFRASINHASSPQPTCIKKL